jgi:hypothetical protein
MTTPRITPRVLPMTKNDSTPQTMYTMANVSSFAGDEGRLPTWPRGLAESGRSKGPTRLGRIDGRLARAGGVVDFLGVTRPGLRLSLATPGTVPASA